MFRKASPKQEDLDYLYHFVQTFIELVYFVPQCAAGHDTVLMLSCGGEGDEEHTVRNWVCPTCRRRVGVHYDSEKQVTDVIEQ